MASANAGHPKHNLHLPPVASNCKQATCYSGESSQHLVRSVLAEPPRLSAPAMTDAAAGFAVHGFLSFPPLLLCHNSSQHGPRKTTGDHDPG